MCRLHFNRKLGDLSVDEFLTSGFDFEEDDDFQDEDESTQQESKIKKSAPPKK